MDTDNKQSVLSFRQQYLNLIATDPELFASAHGPVIRILTDPAEIQEVEEAQRIKLAERSLPMSWATIGVVFEDQYVKVLRDAVEFPDGLRGTYIRILSSNKGDAGVAVLPIIEKNIVLVRHFRHATRAWHLEIPRGFSDVNESNDQTATRELSEEIGAIPLSLVPLGGIHTNTGMLSEYVVLFMAKIDRLGIVDKAEGIESARLVNVSELEYMIARGEVTDSFTLAALLMAQTHGLLPNFDHP